MIESLALPPEKRINRWHTYLLVWKLHRVLALVFGALLLLMSLSGSLLVLHHEIERAFEPDRHTVPPAARGQPARPLANLARTIAPLAPADYQLFRIEPADTAEGTHKFIFRSTSGTTRWSAFVAPSTGEVLWRGPDQALFSPWLLELHMRLRAGRAGYAVTGLAGVGLVLLGLSGLFLHRERMGALWRHPFRVSLGWRVAFADLHKWIGIAALYFVIVLGVTGAIYACRGFTTTPPRPTSTRAFTLAQLAPLEPMLAAARERFPGAEILRAQLPPQAGGAVTVLLLHREAPVWQKFSRMDFDAATGALRGVRAANELPAGEQFAAMLAPLHFGFYGATWVKWAYFVGGFTPTLLALTGLLVWWHRGRQAGE